MSSINTIPIQQFMQLVKSADIGQQREIKMDLKTAKSLLYCISEINNQLVGDFSAIIYNTPSQSTQDILVQMDGGDFK